MKKGEFGSSTLGPESPNGSVKKKKKEKLARPVPGFFFKEYLDFHQSLEEILFNGRTNRSRNWWKAKPESI
jgi:hypothetical protein